MITGLYASFLLLMFVFLSINVIKGRRSFKIAIGDGENFAMKQKIAVHSNFAQYTPMFLIGVHLCETLAVHFLIIHTIAVIFVTGRIMHAFGVLCREKYENGLMVSGGKFRVRGMIMTFSSLISIAIVLILRNFVS